jgi:ribosomal protein L23
MAEFTLIQTEKSYLVRKTNTYLLVFNDRNFTPNKIEVEKLLKTQGLTPLKITVVNPYKKLKRRGPKGKLVAQKRPKKYYVRLPVGQQIAEPTAET